MHSADSFSADYAEARTKFVAAVENAKGERDSYEHPDKGPASQELWTDVAWFGPRDAERVLVTISGTHGVEGYCGSGAQIDWLRRGELERVPKGTAIMMIHAINPYGFAWDRRVTEDNVDLNRNWIDFDESLRPVNREYAELSELLCPSDWSDASQQLTNAGLERWIKERGFRPFQQAVSGGQYTHPQGIFFGGARSTWSRQTQTRILQDHLDDARKVAIIDYHSGLGPWGYAERMVPGARQSDVFKRAAQWFGCAITSIASGSSSSTHAMGDGLSASIALLPKAEATVVALEVGTKPVLDVLQALRADAWLHTHGTVDSTAGRAIRKQMRDAFYGNVDDWKGMVAGQSLLACRQAIAGLQQ